MSEQTKEEEIKGPLIEKLMLQIQRDMDNIPKSGYNKSQKYAFRTIDDVLNHVRIHCNNNRVTVSPCMMELKHYSAETEGGKTKVRCVVHASYQFTAPDGSFKYVQAIGEGVDFGGDKASYKAMTGAQKYALTQAFSTPCEGLDPENDSGQGPQGR